MKNIEQEIGQELLQIKAIKLEPANPFTWASGWKSPIYCDNRKTLYYPGLRTQIRDAFASLIRKKYANAEVIAGVATGAIAQGALVAEALGLPFIYVRSSAKEHGLGNQVEGEIVPGKKVVVIEDLISTGGSSLKAVNAIRESGMEVLGLCAIFTYGFQVAVDGFNEANCMVDTLTDYNTVIRIAAETGYIKSEQQDLLSNWRVDPANWRP